uniref:Uncharacterized protein n=1 Tax=Pseudomonas phage HRDY3 TaxID=3236930 RepID=A0AB39CER4_9VIRU
MKYEIYQVSKQGLTFEIGVMHSDALTHADVAEHMKVCISATYDATFGSVDVVGAGFCSEGLPIKCWGHSDSLNLSSRGDADEMALASSTLHFNNVKVSAFDRISSVAGNLSQTCGLDIRKMREQIFVVGHQFSAYDIATEDYADFEEGMLLRYKGPGLDADGDVIHMFAVDSGSKYYADFDGVYCVTEKDMRCIFEDSEIVRRLARVQSGVVLFGPDKTPQVVTIDGIVDPWPLTDNHEEFRAIYSFLGQEQKLTTEGSLRAILEFFHIEMD